MDLVFNAIGLTGMVFVLGAYFLQQHGSVTVRDWRYLWLNFAGSAAMAVSLLRFWNLPSFLINCAWALISVYGLIKARRGIV